MFEKMKRLAEKYHAGQFRKGPGNVPYIVHPQTVARTLLEWGEPEDSPAVAVAWGHDLLEDTTVTEAEIREVADDRVLAGIKLLTRPREEDKKLYLRSIVESGDREAMLVKIADRICNSRDFVKLEGKLYAFQYLHEADMLEAALEVFRRDGVVAAARAAWKEHDAELCEEARREMTLGCMLGGAVGDALGAPVEFLDLKRIEEVYGCFGVTGYVEFGDGTGGVTDDTQMALFTAEGILRANVRANDKGICHGPSVVHGAYLRWLRTQGWKLPENTPDFIPDSGWLVHEKALWKERAPGRTCLNALACGRWGELKARNKSKGCGTVMRTAPAGLFFNPVPAYEMGCDFSAITHGHPTGITAGGALAMLVSMLLLGKPLPDAVDETIAFLEPKPEAVETVAALKHAKTAQSVSELGEGWVAEEALAIGVYCALKHTWDFRAGVLEAVNIDGDSDSTGAIAGNILGALNGVSGIPKEWIRNLREREIIETVANDLLTQIETNEDGYSTSEWWEKYPGY